MTTTKRKTKKAVQINRNFPPEIDEKFVKTIGNASGKQSCWLWPGPMTSSGYGIICQSINAVAYVAAAHRVSYEHNYGSIPDIQGSPGLILHHCDVPACVSPHHLYVGTQLDNMRDRSKRGRGNHRAGVDHPNSKTTLEQVEAIRQLYATRKYMQTELAGIFGIEQSTVSRIVRKKTYIK